jgi:hypothetical protein
MSNIKEIITLSVTAGLLLAILANADAATKIVDSVSSAWFGLINTVAGKT